MCLLEDSSGLRTFSSFLLVPSIIFALFLSPSPSLHVTQIRGCYLFAGSSSPSPRRHVLSFFRGKVASISSLVDSHINVLVRDNVGLCRRRNTEKALLPVVCVDSSHHTVFFTRQHVGHVSMPHPKEGQASFCARTHIIPGRYKHRKHNMVILAMQCQTSWKRLFSL